jgi:hypothetical protein
MLSGGQFGCNNTTTMGPARRWPIRCGGACPPTPLSAAAFTSMVFDTSISVVCGWSSCFVLSLLSSLRLAVLMSQSNRHVRIVVRQPMLMSQSNQASLFFLLFFLSMISQDHSIVFFSNVSMKHAYLVPFVQKIYVRKKTTTLSPYDNWS